MTEISSSVSARLGLRVGEPFIRCGGAAAPDGTSATIADAAGAESSDGSYSISDSTGDDHRSGVSASRSQRSMSSAGFSYAGGVDVTPVSPRARLSASSIRLKGSLQLVRSTYRCTRMVGDHREKGEPTTNKVIEQAVNTSRSCLFLRSGHRGRCRGPVPRAEGGAATGTRATAVAPVAVTGARGTCGITGGAAGLMSKSVATSSTRSWLTGR